MNYSKPDVEVLGHAKNLIEGVQGSKSNSSTDGLDPDPNGHIGPAYDLDE